MITETQYNEAKAARDAAEDTIREFHNQRRDTFTERWKRFLGGSAPFTERWKRFLGGSAPFSDDDLVYSAFDRCGCGAGLTYPKDCAGHHRWDCASVIKGEAVHSEEHPSFPFAFYSITSERSPRASGQSTRHVLTRERCIRLAEIEGDATPDCGRP